MKNVLCTICLLLIVCVGCAGRRAHPIATDRRNDRFLSCGAMKREIEQNEVLIARKLDKDKSKLWSNIFWFIWFPPLMDVKEAEKTEAEALQRRNNRLRESMLDMGCNLRPNPVRFE